MNMLVNIVLNVSLRTDGYLPQGWAFFLRKTISLYKVSAPRARVKCACLACWRLYKFFAWSFLQGKSRLVMASQLDIVRPLAIRWTKIYHSVSTGKPIARVWKLKTTARFSFTATFDFNHERVWRVSREWSRSGTVLNVLQLGTTQCILRIELGGHQFALLWSNGNYVILKKLKKARLNCSAGCWNRFVDILIVNALINCWAINESKML